MFKKRGAVENKMSGKNSVNSTGNNFNQKGSGRIGVN
jgi:hypothetical protein